MMFPDHFSKLRICSALCIALSLSIAPTVAKTPSAPAMAPATGDAIVIAKREEKAPLKAADPLKLRQKYKGKAGLEVRGAKVERMHGKSAGQGKEAAPGAKFISRKQWRKMKKPPKTGLYFVDADFVPVGIMKDLTIRGYHLRDDGTLTVHGKPVTLFITPETYLVKPDRDAGPPKGKGKPDGGSESEGALLHINPLERPLRFASAMLDLAGDAVESLLVSKAHAAEPVPWRCISAYWAVHYGTDSCFLFDAWTDATAWGADSSGGCGSTRSPTNIEFMQTYVMVEDDSHRNYRFNSHESQAGVYKYLACHWPGASDVSSYNSLYWKDGGASIFRYHRWN